MQPAGMKPVFPKGRLYILSALHGESLSTFLCLLPSESTQSGNIVHYMPCLHAPATLPISRGELQSNQHATHSNVEFRAFPRILRKAMHLLRSPPAALLTSPFASKCYTLRRLAKRPCCFMRLTAQGIAKSISLYAMQKANTKMCTTQ